MVTAQFFWNTEPLESIELYLGHGPEMLGYLVVALRGETTGTLASYFMVLKCVSLRSTSQNTCTTVVTLMVVIENYSWKKGNNICFK